MKPKHIRAKTNLVILMFFFLPLLLGIPALTDLVNPTLVIFPTNAFGNRIEAFNDSGWNGRSSVDEFSFDSKRLTFRYTIRGGGTNPVVFISMWLDRGSSYLDLSAYSSLSFDIKEATNKRLTFFIKTFLPEISKPGEKNAVMLRHNQYILHLSPDIRSYAIDLADFATPTWWLDSMHLQADKVPGESFARVAGFDMQFTYSDTQAKTETQETIRIEKIAFHRTITPLSVVLLCIMVLAYAGLIFFVILRKRLTEKQGSPDRKPLELKSYRDEDLARIKHHLEEHYTDEEISTRSIYKTLGIPASRVFRLLREEYGLSFKQLLNKMRIEESRRLLRETDVRIIDIALRLGFNDISYFNKLFKKSEGETPSDFRQRFDS